MAHSGIGLWISLRNSSVICLYHTETFKHLQDINIASNVLRVTSSQRDSANNHSNKSVFVTALMASKGLLWVGTNVDVSLTIPLPRLEGVPIISGCVNISYHAHFGPVTFLMPLLPKSHYKPPANEPMPTTTVQQQRFDDDEKRLSDGVDVTLRNENADQKSTLSSTTSTLSSSSTLSSPSSNGKDITGGSGNNRKAERSNSQEMTQRLKAHLVQSPVVLRRRRTKDSAELSRMSKTLPRGLGAAGAFTASIHSNTSSSQGSDQSGCDVYGLYGDLIFVKEDYDNVEQGQGNLMDPTYENLRRSEPELAAIATQVNTLDHRLRMKVSRPRSLDLSNWSMDSRSSSLYTSSGSEESMALRQGLFSSRSVSRNSSNASHKTGTSDLMNICENSTDLQIVPTASTPPSATSTMNRPNKLIEQTQREQVQTVVAATLKKKKNSKNAATVSESNGGRRSIITLTGGRGYINWKPFWYNQPADKSSKGNQTLVRMANSTNDAHVVMWEKKL